MPSTTAGKKRKAADTKMWGSSPSTSSNNSIRRGNGSKGAVGGGGGGGSRRGGGAGLLGSSGSSAISDSEAEKLFEELCDDDNPDAVSTDGICKLCERLDLDPLEDVRVLVLLWKMGANKKPQEIQKEEWMAGCRKLQLDSIDTFIRFLPQLDTGFMDNEEFGDFYKFCFQFNRAGTHKTLDKDLVVLLLKMCLAGGRIDPERLDTFCDFLESTVDENYSKITLDQWRSFLDFSHEHPTSESLLGYDEGESAWPVLIDEYCEYMAKKMGKEKK